MDNITKDCAKMLIEFLAIELELKLDDVLKENLPYWQEITLKDKQVICQSIARHWLKQEKQNNLNNRSKNDL
jgi:hypothetical protein